MRRSGELLAEAMGPDRCPGLELAVRSAAALEDEESQLHKRHYEAIDQVEMEDAR